MGIYDRDYYREQPRGGLGGALQGQSAAVMLIWVYVLVFLVEVFTQQRGAGSPFIAACIFNAGAIGEGEAWRLYTGNFLHNPAQILSIVCNMLILWYAGRELCEIHGNREFTVSFLLVGLIGSLAAFLASLAMDQQAVFFNATPAITAALTVFAMHFPKRQILLFFIIPVPLWALVALIVAKDFLFVGAGGVQTIVFVPTLVSVALGIAYYKFHWRVTGLVSFKPKRRRPALRIYPAEEVPAPRVVEKRGSESDFQPAAALSDEQMEARLDEVLEKVQQHGQASLDEKERELLFRASEIYRKRRNRDAR